MIDTGVTAPAPGELEVTEAGVTPIACPVVDGTEALGINICVPEAVLVVDALDVELDDKLFVFTAIEGESDFKEPLYNTAPD